jgi:Protein of unknown function (DUF3551)
VLKALVLSLASVVLATSVGPAIAQGAAWCLREPGAGVVSCSFHSFAQCQASRPGGSTHCVQNPAQLGAGGEISGRERRK